MQSAASQRVRVVVVDRKELRRTAVIRLFKKWAASQNAEIVAASTVAKICFEETQMAILSIGGDAVSNDEHMNALSLLHDSWPNITVVVLADDESVKHTAAAICMGVKGYLQSDITPELADLVLSSLLHGGSYFPLSALQRLVGHPDHENISGGSLGGDGHSNYGEFNHLYNYGDDGHENGNSRHWRFADQQTHVVDMLGGHSEGAIAPVLSPKEKLIVRCLVAGDSNKHIARRIDIAEATVKVHIKAILRKIGVQNRTQVAIWGLNDKSSANCNSPLNAALLSRLRQQRG